MAVDLPDIYLEMNPNHTSANGDAAIVKWTWVPLDTTKYDGTVSYSFEIHAYNPDCYWDTDHYDAADHTVLLVDEDDNTVASIFVASDYPNDTTQDDLTRYRESFTPTSGDHSYYIKFNEYVEYRFTLGSCRIIVHQTGATKTQLAWRFGWNSNLAYAPNSLAQNAVGGPFWEYIASEMSTISALSFEAYGKGVGASGGSLRLKEWTSGDTVATLTWSLNEEAIKTTSVDLSDLTGASGFVDDADWSDTVIPSAFLRITIDPIVTITAKQRVNADLSIPRWNLDAGNDRVLFHSAGGDVYFDGHSLSVSKTVNLLDGGTDDIGSSGTEITDISVGTSGYTRSDAITLTEDNRYIATSDSPGGSQIAGWVFIVHVISAAVGGWKDFMPMLMRII